jgi:hypothetical protein
MGWSESAGCSDCRVRRSMPPQARASSNVVPLVAQRRGPKPKMPDADLLEAIRADLAASPFIGEGHRKVWARLRILHDLRVSRTRVLRLMRENALRVAASSPPGQVCPARRHDHDEPPERDVMGWTPPPEAASMCQIYGPPRFCNPDLRWRVGLLKSIRRRCGNCSPRHDEIRA